MNNRKFKSKKRKLSDLDESAGEESDDKAEDIDSDSDGDSSSSSSSSSSSKEEKQDESDSGRDSSVGHQSSSSSMKGVKKSKSSANNVLLSFSSDSGDETCDKCAICLRSITSQEVGSPEVCDHLFCSVCITEWSKNSNVCPLDRQPFSIILVRENKNGNVVKKVPVDEHQTDQAENVELLGFDDTVCEICGSGDREDIMLLCDICDKGFHTICLTPPLENIPDENEWFCPDCDYQGPNRREPTDNTLDDSANVPSTYRSLRPRIQLVRTRLLERIRITVNRIVDSYVFQNSDEIQSSVASDGLTSTSELESSSSSITTNSEQNASDDVPSTSGLQVAKPKQKKTPLKRRRKTTKQRKRRTKTGKSKTTTKKKKTSSTKRKTTKKKTTRKRKTKVRTTKTKKIKVENEDGTITEKIVKTKTYKRRRQKKRKRKAAGGARRGLRMKSTTTPKTVKGRLAHTLGMLPTKKPGQLLPDVRVRPSNQSAAIDLNRARAGIPKLHIFEPRDELQYYSSASEGEEFVGSSSGGVATVAQPRTNHLRIRNRKKAALALQSASSKPKPRPVIESPPSECVDILGSILDSQAIWHSKNTNVNIREDGSIEVIKDKNKDKSAGKEPKSGTSEKIDVREKNSEGMATQAPMYPGAGSRPGGFRPYNRSGYSESRSGQSNVFTPRSGQSSTSLSFNRFGGPARNDREGYTNYLNNIPQGPTPFCRGGPPLRFRMPARQQLRRITFPARNRPAWQPDDDDEDADESANSKEEKREDEEKKDPIPTKSQEEEDIDLYSDIETNTEKPDNSGPEDGGSSYPALGPPPEPSAFLLGLDENGEFDLTQAEENKNKSDVYDPAEPCDSDDEMVIDEKAPSTTPDRSEAEKLKTEVPPLPNKSSVQSVSKSPTKEAFEKGSSEDDDEDCPIFSIYSSATREFSQKEEEERQREIEEDKRKIEEMKLQEEKNVVTELFEKTKPPEEENKALEININDNDKNDGKVGDKNDGKLGEKNDEKVEDKSDVKMAEKNEKEVEDKNDKKLEEKGGEKLENKIAEKEQETTAEKLEEKNDKNVEDKKSEIAEGKKGEEEKEKKGKTADVEIVEVEAEKNKENEVENSLSLDVECIGEYKIVSKEGTVLEQTELNSESSKSVSDVKEKEEQKCQSSDSEVNHRSSSPGSARGKSSSSERTTEKYKRSKRKARSLSYSESETEFKKNRRNRKRDDDKENDETTIASDDKEKDDINDCESLDKTAGSDNESSLQKVAAGLEGLEVEEVSSENGEDVEFTDRKSLSSLSFSEPSNSSRRSRSPVQLKKRKKNKKRKADRSKKGLNYEEGELDDSEKDNRLSAKASKNENTENEDNKAGEKRKHKSASRGPERQVLGSKENKKVAKEKSKDKDLSWKKPSKKEKNYREGKKRSKDTRRSKSNERRRSKSPSPKKDRKKNKDRKKKADKKKDIERYDVRKIVKNKEVRKTDAFGRDLLSKSRSISRSRSRTPVRDRTRNMLRRDSRSFSRSRSRSFRRGRSPVRRRYARSRTRSRTKSPRRSYSRSRSRSRSRKSKKKQKSKDRVKIRSRSRGRKSRSVSRGRRRSLSRSRSRSPIPRVVRSKKASRSRRSWSHRASRSPSFSSRRSRSVTRSPVRMKRSYTRSISTGSWSRGRSPLPRTSSLEKLTVVLTTKDKKKWKKKKDGKKVRKEEKKRKKGGNLKEVFASGDNVLVSVNFRNSNNAGGNNSGSIINTEGRNTHLNSLSPVPGAETSRKKKKNVDYDSERVTKKLKKSNPISKKVVDVALANACPKRAKKLTRLTEKDAEVILKRKPVAVIDLDMSPYREQTPSPVNVVVVSDSGSGDEGKEHSPQRQIIRGTPAIEVEKIPENTGVQSVNTSAPSSPLENGYLQLSGPKTPPEPQIKFSIVKPQQLRQIANPLGDDDDDDEDDDDVDEVEQDEVSQTVESLDRRIEKELNSRPDVSYKGPNTPPAPRGPSTPKTPPSPQSSPDAYDPFEPTKSRSPSPNQADKENRPSPKPDSKNDQVSAAVQIEGLIGMVSNAMVDNSDKSNDIILENHEDKIDSVEKGEAIPVIDSSNVVIPVQVSSGAVQDITNESPERKISVVITTPQNKSQTLSMQKPYTPVVKQLPMVSSSNTAPPTSASLTVTSDVFSIPSPTKTSRSSATTIQPAPMTGIQRLQHRLGSPVNRTPSTIKTTPEKRPTPRTEQNEIFTTGNYMVRNANKRNGEQPKQPRPLQDATNETIDISMDMDDSPYSPASSEGDDLFDPPVETVKPTQSNSKTVPPYKPVPKAPHKSPVKQLSKFDLLFGPSLSPLKVVNKKTNAKVTTKTPSLPKGLSSKPQKKAPIKKSVPHKMDEDQLRILDDLPSSAVELQVKDKFLKKLNRQERVVDEVKTVLKPHYARKHITKEEYKDILRRSVPKICHSRSGEINPSKIQSLIEAYVRKFRHAKKKAGNVPAKAKVKKTMFS